MHRSNPIPTTAKMNKACQIICQADIDDLGSLRHLYLNGKSPLNQVSTTQKEREDKTIQKQSQ